MPFPEIKTGFKLTLTLTITINITLVEILNNPSGNNVLARPAM
jgi:hypothetical protein